MSRAAAAILLLSLALPGCEEAPANAPAARPPAPAAATPPPAQARTKATVPSAAGAAAARAAATLAKAEGVYVDLLCLGRQGGDPARAEARGKKVFAHHGMSATDYQKAMVRLKADPGFSARISRQIERTCPPRTR